MIPYPYSLFAGTVAAITLYYIGRAEGKAKAPGYKLHWSAHVLGAACALLLSAAVQQ